MVDHPVYRMICETRSQHTKITYPPPWLGNHMLLIGSSTMNKKTYIGKRNTYMSVM